LVEDIHRNILRKVKNNEFIFDKNLAKENEIYLTSKAKERYIIRRRGEGYVLGFITYSIR
jgi:hypothetical protein